MISKITANFTAVAVAATAILFISPASLDAQWLKYKTPGIPRTADGKPDLSAPAPKTADGKPDFTGLWREDTSGAGEMGKAMDKIKAQPWAVAVYKQRKENLGSDSPGTMCLPEGTNVGLGLGKVVQTPGLLLMLYNGTLFREVFLDGRELQKDANPDWLGYSVGHWEGDTLVIESNGFNDRTWLDDDGHPHTEKLRITERLHRPDFGHVEVVKTFVDPGALVEPWTVPLKFEFDADTEQLEYVCNENERDRKHLIGKASDEKEFKVSPEVLSKYAGDYTFKVPGTGQIINFAFAVEGSGLIMTGAGPATHMKATSETEFSAEGNSTYQFEMDGAGKVTDVIIRVVEGDFKAPRK